MLGNMQARSAGRLLLQPLPFLNTMIIAVLLLLLFSFSPVVPSSFAQAQADEPAVCDEKVCYIEITRDSFVPADLRVGAGATVVWKNADDRVHAVSIYSAGDGSMLYNSTLLRTGEMFQFTFSGSSTSGRYDYFDKGTAGMAGQIRVEPDILLASAAEARRVKVDFTDPASGIKSVFLSSGRVEGAELLPGSHSLTVSIQAPIDDTLRIKLDRALIDSKSGSGTDAPFRVTADRYKVAYSETATSSERALAIQVPSGTSSVRITGNHSSAAVTGYESAASALEQASKTVSQYRDRGIVVNEADDLLRQARGAFDDGRYVFAKELADEATSVAHAAQRTASAASRAMDQAAASVRATKSLGIDVSDVEEILRHTQEKYSYGGYDEALNMAVQAKVAAASRTDPLLMVLAVAIGAVPAGMYLYRRTTTAAAIQSAREDEEKKKEVIQSQRQEEEKENNVATGEKETGLSPPLRQRQPLFDLERAFMQKPYLRDDDRQVIRYVVEKGGEVLLADIRNRFALPKSTAWRLVKRLEREELVEIIKFGNQNLVKCKR